MEWIAIVVGIVIYGMMIGARHAMVGKKLIIDNPPNSRKQRRKLIKDQIERQEARKRLSPTEIKYIMERSCLRKKNLSLEKANQFVDRSAKEGKTVYFYKCDFCSSYHMTRQPQLSVQKRLAVC